jgi:alkylation response protein AidB-like acyl-CoA dehydrogenase
MRFDLTDEQRAIKDAVHRLCQAWWEQTPPQPDMPTAADALWPKLAASGWTQLCVPRRLGGQGAGLLELSLVIEELGYVLAPATFLGNASAALVLAAADDEPQRRRLSAIAGGDVRAGFGQLRDDRDGVGIDVDGADLLVLLGRDAAVVIAPVPSGLVSLQGLDLTRRFVRVATKAAERIAGPIEAARDCIEVLVATELVGVAQHAMDLAVAHAKSREQFGRPIGAYQAVSHRCADMLVLVESARSAVLSAAWTADNAPADLPFAASVAKVAAVDAAWQVTASALQVHGGMGFTWEHPIHLLLRRAAASSRLSGGVDHHLDRIAALNGVGVSWATASESSTGADVELDLFTTVTTGVGAAG